MFRDACLCTATLILPDFDVHCVSLAISLLTSEVDKLNLEDHIIDIVGPVYSCLKIEYFTGDDSHAGNVKIWDIF